MGWCATIREQTLAANTRTPLHRRFSAIRCIPSLVRRRRDAGSQHQTRSASAWPSLLPRGSALAPVAGTTRTRPVRMVLSEPSTGGARRRLPQAQRSRPHVCRHLTEETPEGGGPTEPPNPLEPRSELAWTVDDTHTQTIPIPCCPVADCGRRCGWTPRSNSSI